ncbi:MAG: hypothetical protein NC416_03575 [Eubacterium sp.]|nr:hypothetical protein [Eubacterium sp.]
MAVLLRHVVQHVGRVTSRQNVLSAGMVSGSHGRNNGCPDFKEEQQYSYVVNYKIDYLEKRYGS